LVVAIAIVVFLFWLASRIEPHWSSRDGHRFVCRVQSLETGRSGVSTAAGSGRWVEARASVEADRVVLVRKVVVRGRPVAAPARVIKRIEPAIRGKAMWVLDDGDQLLALRVPVRSNVVPVMDELIGRG
jgi:hypothetical protein